MCQRKRAAAGLQHGAALDAQRLQGGHGRLDVGHTGDAVNQLRPVLRDARAQGRVIHVKPAPGPRRSCMGCSWVDSNDLEVGARKFGRRQAEDAVVRAHQRVLAARPGRDAQLRLAPRHAFIEAGRHHHQVIDGRVHSVTVPSMQVTDSPPTQTWPPASRSMCTRPARSRQAALRRQVARGCQAVGDQPLRQAGVQAAGDRVFVDAERRGKGAHLEVGRRPRRALRGPQRRVPRDSSVLSKA